MAEYLLKKFNLLQYFNVIVGADDIIRHKPYPDTFLRCAELLKVIPEKCIVFEDADFGIMAAQSAGMSFVDVRCMKYS